TFNGDILLSAEKPLGGLYVFLGDITGHGLAAAIGTIPLSQVFFTMTRKGKSSTSIIREMNRSLRAFLPRSMFCAALLLELDASGSKMRIWSGGLPLCFHLQSAKKQVDLVSSRHLPLGVLDDSAFDPSMESISAEEGDSLLMMTDGIPESVNAKGVMFGLDTV
ncbi:PP2C family protein-serine/threonine phosphatase, partial [Oleiphilus sp. HI0080]